MSITMSQLDACIETTINRLSSEHGTMVSTFYIDLRGTRTRITSKLVEESIGMCASRGLQAYRVGDGLSVTVDLRTCVMNPAQAAAFNLALNYTRQVHGNHL